ATSTSQINLSWTASTDNVGVVGYRINRNGTQVATSGTATFSDTSLVPATAYSYTVSAYDAAGNVSAASAAVSVTTLPLPPVLGTPTASSITSTSATLSGSVDPSSASTSAWFEYGTTTAYGSTTTPTTVTASTTISAPLTSLLPNTLYHFRIAAQNAGGITRGPDQTFTTLAPPDTTAPSSPANLVGTATSTSQINLTWTASTDNVGVVGYRINRNGTQVATSGTATFSDTNLVPA